MGNSYKENINEVEFFVGEINARRCVNTNQLCKELEKSFQQSNSDKVICIEAMYDLNWLDEKNYKVVVKNFYSLENEKMKKLITEELNSYAKYWGDKRQREQNENENKFIIEYK